MTILCSLQDAFMQKRPKYQKRRDRKPADFSEAR
uniref:Uncharacterized protein n=1 Tax=Arundo donax TaxID=35708 RepID=A0A0A9AY33_ARUDO